MSRDSLLHNVAELVNTQLRPLVEDIDRKGLYPESFLRELGKIGGFACVGSQEEGGSGLGLATQIDVLREIGKACGATAFSAWCQAACAWYLHQTPNESVKRYLPDVLSAKVLAGTGMSNTVKHLADIEAHLLQAKPADGGYIVNGMLPWVSNLGDNHIWANAAQTPDGYVMFITGAEHEGVSLIECPEFCALEGTRTFGIKFDNVFVPHEDVLAEPDQFEDYIKIIKPGFILLQNGMAEGIIDDCLKEIEIANVGSETNYFLENGIEELSKRHHTLLLKTKKLADDADQNQANMLETLQLRADISVLTLDAAQSAVLHAGAKGYLMSSPVQRRAREAAFVAIVTPALKHLLKEISELEFMGSDEFSI
ncbi:acyl-CoA dehydrogenase family protein [Neisseria montereyensis]|uniref:Acyl-CoA/acyl-ACP dehydrogenase n=1 Tax=Neisseria montereyensis TaxID=2973938 RepID=A0ABT2FC85_9NEIS|nr:acyl-CoA dehydrogenase family protein [Neisseria montereyensis]MCS4533753.1 acyl-CoA/acyl-ACP dehydrogenase [Neisseria montereyensis]